MTAPDWRKILVAYIDHVRAYEGTDFLPATLGDLEGLNAEERASLYDAAVETIPGSHVHARALLRKKAAELRGESS